MINTGMYSRGHVFGGPPGSPAALSPVRVLIAGANDTADWSTIQLSDLSNVGGVTGTATTAGTHTVVGSNAATLTAPILTDQDGDSNLAWSTGADDRLVVTMQGSERFFFRNKEFRNWAGGGLILNVVPTATQPVFCPLAASTTTGWGANATGEISGIAGGTEVFRLDQTNTAGATRLVLYDVDAGKMQRVWASTNNAGGTGRRNLQIANTT